MDHCLSCHKSIPKGEWLCEECFSYMEEIETKEGEDENITEENLIRGYF